MADANSTDKVYFRQRPAREGAFSDNRVFLVRLGDKRIPGISDASVFIQQAADGPTYVSISAKASDSALKDVHSQYQVPINDLRKFLSECIQESQRAELTAKGEVHHV